MKKKLVFLSLLIVVAVCMVGFIGCSSTEVMQQQYVVYFDTNGHGHLDNSYVSTDIIEEAPIPSADYDNQYTFAGWYTSPDCSDETKVSFPYIVTENITFYAKWEKQEVYFSFILNESGTGYILSNCHGNPSEIIIPDIYHDLPVTEVSGMAFRECNELTNIIFSENSQVTNIPSYAFNYCYNLRAITLPANLMEIGFAAFPNIPLTIYYPGEIKDWCEIEGLGNIMFSDPAPEEGLKLKLYIDTQLVQGPLTIPDDVTKISDGAFANTMITSLVLPDGITSIGARSFWNCFELSIIEFGNNSNLTSIDDNAFAGCFSLENIEIPDGLMSIGSEAFGDCQSMTELTIPASVTSIGSFAFGNCSGLENVTFCENSELKNIAPGLFNNCCLLEDIEIPNGVISIGYTAFKNCNNLTSITIPDTVTNIGSEAFIGTGYYNNKNNWDAGALYISKHLIEMYIHASTDTIKEGTLTIADYAFAGTPYGYQGNNIKIPNSVRSIGEGAFLRSNLTSIEIPNSVVYIGNGAFNDCNQLSSITVAEGNSVYHSSNNCLIETSSKSLIAGCSNSVIPADGSVTIIATSAFEGTGITSITIPSCVTTIEDGAFDDCYDLTEVIFADGSQLTTIGKDAFSSCSSLKNIVIPYGVITISSCMFDGCDELMSVTIPKSVTSIESCAFRGCSALTSITIPESVADMGIDVFERCNKLVIYLEMVSEPEHWWRWNYSHCPVVWDCRNNVFSEDGSIYVVIDNIRYSLKDGIATVIGQKNDIKEAFIPASVIYEDKVYNVKSIVDYAFYGCYGLEKLIFDEDSELESIGYSAFYDCICLTGELKIPDSVTSIGEKAFLCCEKINGLIFGHESLLKSIGDEAFWGLSGLTGLLIIPGNVTDIGYAAFSGCSITGVMIPSSVTNIEDRAFGWGPLEIVYYSGTEKQWNIISIGEDNDSLTSAIVYYYSDELTEEQKADSNSYWHYVDGVPTVWEKGTI